MTNQEQPDTRPRCADCGFVEGDTIHDEDCGSVEACVRTHPNDEHGYHPFLAAPAPDTQSGGRPTVEEARQHEAEMRLAMTVEVRSALDNNRWIELNPPITALIGAVESRVLAESSAALQEARDRLARATKYVEVLPGLREVARTHGYALAVHGSGSRDLDLIAAPWVDEVSPPEVLAEALREAVGGVILNTEEYREHGDYRERNPQPKPHGRLSWSIHLPARPGVHRLEYLDLSVMPAESTIAGLREQVEGLRGSIEDLIHSIERDDSFGGVLRLRRAAEAREILAIPPAATRPVPASPGNEPEGSAYVGESGRLPAGEKFCDCPKCPCNVPLEGARYGKKDCAECLAGNHMDWKTAERSPAAPGDGALPPDAPCMALGGNGRTCGKPKGDWVHLSHPFVPSNARGER